MTIHVSLTQDEVEAGLLVSTKRPVLLIGRPELPVDDREWLDYVVFISAVAGFWSDESYGLWIHVATTTEWSSDPRDLYLIPLEHVISPSVPNIRSEISGRGGQFSCRVEDALPGLMRTADARWRWSDNPSSPLRTAVRAFRHQHTSKLDAVAAIEKVCAERLA